jgi:hypothetical protein
MLIHKRTYAARARHSANASKRLCFVSLPSDEMAFEIEVVVNLSVN